MNNEYLDLTLSSEERELFEAWQSALHREGARIRAAGQVSADDLDRLWQRCASELKPSRGWTMSEATMLLRNLIEPICGFGTVEKTLALARHRSAGQNYANLLSQWSTAIASICGSATGELVLSVGTSISAEVLG